MSTKCWQFVLQWHVTVACPVRCRHCYLYEEATYDDEVRHPLSTEECVRVMDDYVSFVARLAAEHGVAIRPRIHFTGGDPLLREDLFALLQAAGERGIAVGILGNPYLLTEEVARRLREHGVQGYQISVDGLEKTHDSLRCPGSFAESLRALATLQRAGITDRVMFTLSRLNAGDLIPVMRLMAERQVASFDFARLASCGAARDLDAGLTPEEYRALLLEVHAERKRLAAAGAATRFGFKDHLWTLLLHELGEFEAPPGLPGTKILGGCSAGLTFMALLADGSLYACRRFPSRIGSVRQDSLYDLFRFSETLWKLRSVGLFEKCRHCPLGQRCRGCPAVAAGANAGNFLAPDPQCWWKP